MKRKIKPIFWILSTLCILSLSAFFACANEKLKIEFVESSIQYRAGTNVDLIDFIKVRDNTEYIFSIKKVEDSDYESVKGRTFFAEKSGTYDLFCEARSGDKTASGTTKFTVEDTAPFAMIDNSEISVNYKSKTTLKNLCTLPSVFLKSDTQQNRKIDYVNYYKNPYVTEYVKIDLTGGAVGDGFYDGNGNVVFNREGTYKFHLIISNDGGETDGSFTVAVRENLGNYQLIDGNGGLKLEKSGEDYVATWNVYSGASAYRVKIDYENIIVNADVTSLKISDYFVEEAGGFQNFDLAVIPLDENGNNMKVEDGDGYDTSCYMTVKDVIIAPEQFGSAVVSRGTKVNAETGVVSLEGKKGEDLSTQGFHSINNNYIAWKGGYNIGTYVDVIFSGNNLPNICLFANNVNGDMSYGMVANEDSKNKGLLIQSGFYARYNGNLFKTGASDTVVVFGPNRYETGWSLPYNRWNYNRNSEEETISKPRYIASDMWKPSEYVLLTQDGLSADKSGKTYRYMVGTYAEGDKLMLDIRLYEYDLQNKKDKKIIYNIHFDPEFKTNQFDAGNIIAYAPVKENAEASQFIVSKPYDGVELYFPPDATINEDGSVTLHGANPGNNGSVGFTSKNTDWLSGYYFNENKIGLNDFVDIEFIGNNLPYLTFFADKKSGDLSGCDGAKGITLINGLVNKGGENRTDRVHVYGPDRYGLKNGQNAYKVDSRNSNPGFSDLTRLAQNNLDENTKYKLSVGTKAKEGIIYIVFSLYSGDEYTAICENVEINTTVTVTEMKTALGLAESEELEGYIIFHGAMKGTDGTEPYGTTFFASDIYQK